MAGREMLRRNQVYCQGSLAFSSTNKLPHNLEDSDGSYTDNDSISSDDEISVHPLRKRQRSQNEPNYWPNLLRLSLAGNDALLWDISGYIWQCWKEVGRHLLMNESLVDNIDIDHDQEGEKEKAYQLLVKWSRKMPIRATVKNLQNVLVHIGRKDIADTIPSLYRRYAQLQIRQQHASTSSERTKTEIEGHIKLQKLAMQELNRNLKFYKKEVKEIKELSSRFLEKEEARELQEKLKELDNMEIVEGKLDFLQRQIHNMQQQERSKEWTVLDGKLRDVAQRLHEVEKTVKQYTDTVDELRVFPECTRFGEFLCSFSRILPRRSARSEKRKSAKTEEELDDNVFEYPCQATRPGENNRRRHPHSTSSLPNNTFSMSSPTRTFHHSLPRKKSSQAYRNAEEHVRRRFNVSPTLSIDEQFQLQEIIDNSRDRFISREKPFIYSHSCINKDLQSDSPPDFSTLPIPCYKSSEAIASLVTKFPTKYDEPGYSTFNAGSCGLLSIQQGFFNVVSDLV